MIGAKNEKFSISGNYAMAALGGQNVQKLYLDANS